MNQAGIEQDIRSNPQIPADFADRFWKQDPTLWGRDSDRQEFIGQFLGWINAPRQTLEQVAEIEAFAQAAHSEGIREAVVLGMGGSSLSALMLSQTFAAAGPVRLHVLDSTVPAEVLKFTDNAIFTPETTLFIVASKSGTTVEPLAFEECIYDHLVNNYGKDPANRCMVAITDPGSQMEARSRERGYRHTFLGEPTVGGRFSLLTVFGMVPAALAGVDIRSMLESVAETIGDPRHPGFELGRWMGHCALAGRDKITFVTSPGFESVGLWAEQLIAESTGKDGKGILPLATEPVGQPDTYGSDRAFILVDPPPSQAKLPERIGAPFLTLDTGDAHTLANTLYSLEIATGVAGAILDVNPFDQPNVQAAKDVAKRELASIQETGGLPKFNFEIEDSLVAISGSNGQTVGQALASFINQGCAGDVATFLAFIPETPQTTAHIQNMRSAIRDRLNLATAFGYGPRYLHSTGQFHKGGPDNGLYIVITAQDAADLLIPGMGVTLGQLKTAQALGDIGALRSNGRRVVHVHFKTSDVESALAQLSDALHIASAP